MDCSPPGSFIHGIFQARVLQRVAISFSKRNYRKKVKLLNRVGLCETPWTASYQAPSSMEFSRWEYWSFSFSIIPSKEIPGLISFRMDWLDLLAAQGTLKSLLQHHSSNASTLQCSVFFPVQLSHPHVTPGETTSLCIVASPVAQLVVSACSAGDPGSIPGLERSPGEGNENLLQDSCLENSMDEGAW